MPKRSTRTKLAIAGSAVNVKFPICLSFNEAKSLAWALRKIEMLTTKDVVTAPKDVVTCLYSAIERVAGPLHMTSKLARKSVAKEVRRMKG